MCVLGILGGGFLSGLILSKVISEKPAAHTEKNPKAITHRRPKKTLETTETTTSADFWLVVLQTH